MKDILVDLMLESLNEPSFGEKKAEIVGRLKKSYKQIDGIRFDLEVLDDFDGEKTGNSLTSLVAEVEEIVDKIEDIIRKMEVV